jgi:hypothetical protein
MTGNTFRCGLECTYPVWAYLADKSLIRVHREIYAESGTEPSIEAYLRGMGKRHLAGILIWPRMSGVINGILKLLLLAHYL